MAHAKNKVLDEQPMTAQNASSGSPFLAAAVQMRKSANVARDWATAERLVADAAEQGAKLVVLPELFFAWGPIQSVAALAEAIPGLASQGLSELAKRYSVTLVAGSLPERQLGTSKAWNTCLVFGPDGELLGRYRKQHLFDIDLPGKISGRESDWIAAGEESVVVETPVGRIGLAICFDLRFPELFSALVNQGCQVIVVPSAFSHETGRDHWDVLLRARAIETQSYVIAANQWGTSEGAFKTYGHSQIIDPWGIQLASAGEAESVVLAKIDLNRVTEVRRSLPLRHRN